MSEAKIVLTAVDQTKVAIESAKRNMASLGDTVARATSLMMPMAAAAAITAGTIQHLSKALETMDLLDDMSEKTGVSVEALSKLRFAGESVGTTTEQLGAGLKHLSKLMGEAAGGSEEAANVFKTMGVQFKDANGNLRSADKVLEDMAERFSGWADGPGKAALAMKALGKSGMDMIPVLNLGKDGLGAAADEAKRLGAVLGSDAAKAAADFNDSMKKLSLTSEAATQKIAGEFLPGLNKMAKDFLAAAENSNLFVAALISIKEALKFNFGFDQLGAMESELKIRANSVALLGKQLEFAQKQADSGITGAAERAKGIRAQLESAMAASAKLSNNFQSHYMVAKDPEWASRYKSRANSSKPDAPIVGKKDPAKAQSDFGANFINQLTSQYASLSGSMSKVDEVQRMLNVSGDKLTQTQRNQALATAAQIDAFNYKKQANDAEMKGLVERVAINEQLELAYAKQKMDMLTSAQDLQFEASLIGKNADEVARLRFERELLTKVRAAESVLDQQLERGNLTSEAHKQEMADLKRLSDASKEMSDRMADDQLDRQNNMQRGLSDGLRDYMQEAQSYGDSTRNAVTSAFRGMEDSMINFVKTGKLDFKSLADSIITDMIRIQVQQSITGPLSQILGQAFGSKYTPGSNSFVGPMPQGSGGALTFSANGNIMTSDGPMALNMYANGGIATSPQLSVFGEGRLNEAYVPLPDGRTIPVTMSGGGGSNVIVNVMPTSGQTADVQQRQNSDGTTTIDVILRQVQDGLADGVASGSGSLFNAIGSRFVPQGAR